MKTSRKMMWLAIPLAFALLTTAWLPPAAAADKTYKMSGEVTGVNTQHNTVVVEVPMGKETFTVAGPLASDAKIMKNGRSAELSDFQTGDKATVTFHSGMQGHVIDALTSR